MVEQISVFLQNRAGKIAAITAGLAEAGIDLRALSIADTTDFGVLRMLVSDTEKAKKTLEEQRFLVSLTPVTVVAVPDVPGGLAGVLARLEEHGINIEYMYSLIGRGEQKAYMVFRVSDAAELKGVLAANGLATVSRAELGIK